MRRQLTSELVVLRWQARKNANIHASELHTIESRRFGPMTFSTLKIDDSALKS